MELSEKLQTVLEWGVSNGEVAGISVLVLHRGEEIAYTQAGFADKQSGKAFQRDTICRLYSMTKPVTAVAAMILMERGSLDIGQSVGDIIPAFSNMQVWEQGKKVAARRNVLVKDLLTMTSGISYPGTDDSGQEVDRVFRELNDRLYGDDPMTTMEWAEKIGACGLAFHPGQKWMYGSSADVLGAVIETVSGKTLGEFMQEEIFAPLGMADTDFWVHPENQHRLAQIYERGEPEMRCVRTDNLGICYTQHRKPTFQSGGAGLCGTIDDYAKLAQSLLGHGTQILSEATRKFLAAPELTPWQQECAWQSWESMQGYTYGNLMRRMTDPGMALFNGWRNEYGWDGWLGTYFCNSPDTDTTVLMFCQRKDAGTMPLTRRIRNVITAEIEVR